MMLRALFLFSLFGLSAAQTGEGISDEQRATCIVDSGETVSDALDAAMFLWAATKRCSKGGNTLKCTVDVASAAKAVTGMIKVILEVAGKCGVVSADVNWRCGTYATGLVQHSSAIAEASAQVDKKCTGTAAPAGIAPKTAPLMCAVDLKGVAANLFKAVNSISRVKADCVAGSRTCIENGLRVATAMAGMGQFLAGSIGQCDRANSNKLKINTRTDLCAQASISLVEYAGKVATDGLRIADECTAAPAARLYSQVTVDENSAKKEAVENSSITMVLGALIPVTALVGFVGGKSLRRHSYVEARSDIAF